jgi:hypothetical protein
MSLGRAARGPARPRVYDDAAFQSPAWKNVKQAVRFWKICLATPGDAPIHRTQAHPL